MQARSGCPQNNCTGILELATWAVHSCLLSFSPSLSLLASQGTLLLNPVQIRRCLRWHSSSVSKNPKLVPYHDPSKHTYTYDKCLKDWLWGKALELITCGLSGHFVFFFLVKPAQIAFIWKSDWIQMVGYGMAVLIFSNDLTYLQLFVPIPFSNLFCKFKYV